MLTHIHALQERIPIKMVAASCIILVVGFVLLGFIFNDVPDDFDVNAHTQNYTNKSGESFVTGSVTVSTLIRVTESLWDKRGGYLSNDLMSPGAFMDNVPNWEFGVIVQVRDLARALRNDISRSQSQSIEDKDLSIAEPQIHYNSDSWLLPSTEGEYKTSVEAMKRYLKRLSNEKNRDAQFYARADNLSAWLALVEKRLGSLSQRLSASVGQVRLNTDLAGDPQAEQSTPTPYSMEIKTSWFEIDDVFYEARGTAWALSHFLKAVEIDFDEILKKKNALVSLRQITRELDATQKTLWSPMVLNGSGFGFFANHSLVMANYISRANTAIIELRILLEDG